MKVVIFAGGFGTRISEETAILPKPLVEIGGRPILWHIMKIYAAHGMTDFIICCGYKGHLIKQYFMDAYYRSGDFTLDLATNDMEMHRTETDPWKVTLADTGLETMTGGRLARVRDYIGDETFCLTYGDGVTDLDITKTIEYHRAQGTKATVTAVQQPGRFGALDLSGADTLVKGFREKATQDVPLINGGFFVCEPSVIDYVEGDDTVWEEAPLRGMVNDRQLSVYRHEGYWQNMDTLRDKNVLQKQWDSGTPPWKVWDN